MIRVLAAAVVIAMIVVGWLLLDRQQNYAMLAAPPPPTTPSPGYSASDAEIVETGPDGLNLYTLRASTITQLPDDQVVSLEQVRMQLKDDSGGLWNVNADHGQILQDVDLLELTGHVDIAGFLQGSDQPAHITTGRISLDTRTDLATTKDTVDFDWAGSHLRTRGLSANLKDHSLKLESDVHGTLRP